MQKLARLRARLAAAGQCARTPTTDTHWNSAPTRAGSPAASTHAPAPNICLHTQLGGSPGGSSMQDVCLFQLASAQGSQGADALQEEDSQPPPKARACCKSALLWPSRPLLGVVLDWLQRFPGPPRRFPRISVCACWGRRQPQVLAPKAGHQQPAGPPQPCPPAFQGPPKARDGAIDCLCRSTVHLNAAVTLPLPPADPKAIHHHQAARAMDGRGA